MLVTSAIICDEVFRKEAGCTARRRAKVLSRPSPHIGAIHTFPDSNEELRHMGASYITFSTMSAVATTSRSSLSPSYLSHAVQSRRGHWKAPGRGVLNQCCHRAVIASFLARPTPIRQGICELSALYMDLCSPGGLEDPSRYVVTTSMHPRQQSQSPL